MSNLLQDFRFALRTLRKNPLFAAVAVLSLALGIGANTAIFSFLNQVLFRMLPVHAPQELVVFHSNTGSPGRSSADTNETVFSYPMYKDVRDRNTVFSGLIARHGVSASVSRNGQAEMATAELCTGNFFEVLGVRPALGRVFRSDDDVVPEANPVVVLTYGYWKSRFGGDPSVVNEKVGINGVPMTVVGISAEGFRSVIPGNTPDFFVPVNMKRSLTPTWDGLAERRVMFLNFFGRLKPGVTPEAAQSSIRDLMRPIYREEGEQMGPVRSQQARDKFLNQQISLLPGGQGINDLRASAGDAVIILMAMVGFVLLIACANVANLLIVRASGRQKEIAIRLALGAGRAVLIRQLLVESVLLSLGGGIFGLLFASWLADGLLHILPSDASGGWITFQLDSRILLFNFALSVATGLLFGLVPALQATRPRLVLALKDQSAGAGAGVSHARFRRAMVVAQVALSLVLLVAAGLFTRSLYNLVHFDPGFQSQNLLTFSVNPRLAGYAPERSLNFYNELHGRLSALPGVKSVAAVETLPISNSHSGANVTVEGYQAGVDEETNVEYNTVSPDTFITLGIPLLAGREFTDADGPGAPKVVIVNESFAKHFIPNRNPIGMHMTFGAGNKVIPDREIIGVVRDNKHGSLKEKIKLFVYRPFAQEKDLSRMSFFLRTTQNESSLGPEIRKQVGALDSSMAVFDMKSMAAHIEESISNERLISILSSAFGILAVSLAALGLYGVIAFTVARRTSEFGIRIALGASPGNVLSLVMKEVGWLTGIGIVIGVPAALLLGSYVQTQLFGMQASDVAVFTAAVVIQGAVALVSGFVPARRATRVDPMLALRYE
ncbi:MAG: ABC transporter permease [Acidobacteria bacterium]|nr:ABC transporter permease [Acidobacteriota bacterium]